MKPLGRVSVQPRHVTNALPESERIAVEVLELQLWLRDHGPHDAFEILDDGTPAIFLTIGRVQELLRLIGARKRGRDYARQIRNEILPSLGLIEDTGLVKKPKKQTKLGRSFWWNLYRVPVLEKLVSPKHGAYPERPGEPSPTGHPPGLASLYRVLKSQGLIWTRPQGWDPGSGTVQIAFRATGPP